MSKTSWWQLSLIASTISILSVLKNGWVKRKCVLSVSKKSISMLESGMIRLELWLKYNNSYELI